VLQHRYTTYDVLGCSPLFRGGGVLCASMWPGDCWYFVDFASGSSKRKRDKLGGARSVQTLMVS
jgi:hypothetical protein